MSIALGVFILCMALGVGLLVVAWMDWQRSKRGLRYDGDMAQSVRKAEREQGQRDTNAHLGSREKT